MLCPDMAVLNQNNIVYNMTQYFWSIVKLFIGQEKKKSSVYCLFFPSLFLQKNIKEVQQDIRTFNFPGYFSRRITYRTIAQTFNDISSTSLLCY